MDFSLQFRPLELKGLTCARCGETIVAETGYFTSRFVSKHPKVLGRTCEFHPACALAMDLFGFLQAVHEDKTPFTGRGSLEEVLENRTALIRARAAERPTTQKDPLYSRCFLVEPALSIHGGVEQNVPFVRDASGRPTVRILYTGSLFLQPGTRSAQVHRLLANGSYCSAKREYQFVGPTEDFVNATGDCDLPREDPSVPIVGTLSGVSVNHQTPVRGLRHLSLWNAHGLPPPLLWIIGLQRNKPRDGETQKARDALEQAGFSPDESPVVYSRAVDSSALDTLVTALDEYFASGAELRQTQDTLYATATRLH